MQRNNLMAYFNLVCESGKWPGSGVHIWISRIAMAHCWPIPILQPFFTQVAFSWFKVWRKKEKTSMSVFVGAHTSLPCAKNNRHFRYLRDEFSTMACGSKLGLSILSISEIQNPSNLAQWRRKQFANKCFDNGFPPSPRHSEMYAQFNTHKQSALWMDPQIFLSLLFPSYEKAVNGPYHVKYIITRCHPLPWYEA